MYRPHLSVSCNIGNFYCSAHSLLTSRQRRLQDRILGMSQGWKSTKQSEDGRSRGQARIVSSRLSSCEAADAKTQRQTFYNSVHGPSQRYTRVVSCLHKGPTATMGQANDRRLERAKVFPISASLRLIPSPFSSLFSSFLIAYLAFRLVDLLLFLSFSISLL